MVLPAGVTKGSGLLAAARELNVSIHNVVAIGDAENDLSLLETAELGVAVANAVPSVRQRADLVLDYPAAQGVVSLLDGHIVDGTEPFVPRRRSLCIGGFLDGTPVKIPAAQANVLIQGDSGAGKSHLAGLLIEQWIRYGYSVLVLDVEGDYHGLTVLPNVVLLDGPRRPENQELLGLLRQRSLSVIIDLSHVESGDRAAYLRQLSSVIDAERAAWGMPHWVVFDEAHVSLGVGGIMDGLVRPADKGYLFVTYRPEELRSDAAAAMDVTLSIRRSPEGDSPTTRSATIRLANSLDRPFVVSSRRTPHVRHWHKYLSTPLPADQWFHFLDEGGTRIASADTMATFLHCLRTVDSSVIGLHLSKGDFSRWLIGSLQDRQLAAIAAAIERDVLAHRTLELQRARARLLSAIEAFYGITMRDEALSVTE